MKEEVGRMEKECVSRIVVGLERFRREWEVL